MSSTLLEKARGALEEIEALESLAVETMSGKVSGAAVRMFSVTMRCAAGTHAIGVETMEHADSDGVSGAPNIEYASSVGRNATRTWCAPRCL